MSRPYAALLLVIPLLFSCGCQRQEQRQPVHLIFLLDVSGSIEPDSLVEAFQSMEDVLKHLNRGDKASLIPITSDALAESSGRVLRFEKPVKREAYDADLIRFSKVARKSLNELQANTMVRPGSRTDIFGAIKMAEEETAASQMKTELIVLSDLIEDDGEFDFKSDPRLANKERATPFALKMAQPDQKSGFSSVYLGLLRSKDIRELDPKRREAIVEFWKQYFGAKGAHIQFVTDGPGLLSVLEKTKIHF